MRVLVAGDRGYIGTVLTGVLEASGHDWVGLDSGLYEGCDFRGGPGPWRGLAVDMRSVEPHHLEGVDAVICLAALSNDPLGHLDPGVTESINLHGTMQSGLAQPRLRECVEVRVCVVLQSVRRRRLRARGGGRRAEPGDPLRGGQGAG